MFRMNGPHLINVAEPRSKLWDTVLWPVEFKRIKGPIFKSKEEAEEHGLKPCKDWIDKQP